MRSKADFARGQASLIAITDKSHLSQSGDRLKDMTQEAIIPKYKLDRSYNDNMEGRHIG